METTAQVVLVVDDLEMFRLLATTLLGQAGYATRSVSNGAEALDYLNEHPDAAAIVLDLNMPVMGGREFLGFQRADEKLSHIPVVICSGEILAAKDELVTDNVVAFVSKDTSMQDLVGAVQSAVAKTQTTVG